MNEEYWRDTTQRVIFSALAGHATPVADPVASLERMQTHAELLARWNARVNLTAVTEPDEVAEKHFLDSLALLPHVAQEPSLMDIGSGAGFPGLVVASALPTLRVTLVEPSRKRVTFLREAVRTLGLGAVTILPSKLEDIGEHEPPHAVVSRATFPVSDWLMLASRVVRPGGLVIAMEGSERHSLPRGATRQEYVLGATPRALILWRP